MNYKMEFPFAVMTATISFIAFIFLAVSPDIICMIALMKGLQLDWVIIIICAAYPVKCIGYVKFLWRNFD